jgi:GntR family transcriptional repressor for pyruvate dehydrogenase complex
LSTPPPAHDRSPDLSPFSLVDQAADTIRRQLLDGRLGFGDRLPTERELVEKLGVSRTVVREALSRLEALGMIERRTTHGRFVVGGGSQTRSKELLRAWLYQHSTEISEVDEVRAVVEAHIIRGMSPDDAYDAARRARLMSIDQRAAVERGDAEQAAAADVDFHRLLCSYTPNGTMRALATALIDQMLMATLAVYSLPKPAAESLRAHEAIVDALSDADTVRAAELAYEHELETSRRYIPASREEDLAEPGTSDGQPR